MTEFDDTEQLDDIDDVEDSVDDDDFEYEHSNAEDQSEYTSLAMFEGDQSTLTPEQRICLHQLLKRQYISAEAHPAPWATLMQDTSLIISRLHDLFLDLHIDRNLGIAFKRQVQPGDGESLPSLLRSRTQTKEETIIMVSLRRRLFAQRQEGGDKVFIDRQTLLDEVADLRPDAATNRAMDNKRTVHAIDALIKSRLLLKTPDPDRFRISPVVEVLMPIEKLNSLLSWLTRANNDDSAETSPEPDPGEALPSYPLFDTEEGDA